MALSAFIPMDVLLARSRSGTAKGCAPHSLSIFAVHVCVEGLPSRRRETRLELFQAIR